MKPGTERSNLLQQWLDKTKQGFSPIWLPGRSLVFSTMRASFALGLIIIASSLLTVAYCFALLDNKVVVDSREYVKVAPIILGSFHRGMVEVWKPALTASVCGAALWVDALTPNGCMSAIGLLFGYWTIDPRLVFCALVFLISGTLLKRLRCRILFSGSTQQHRRPKNEMQVLSNTGLTMSILWPLVMSLHLLPPSIRWNMSALINPLVVPHFGKALHQKLLYRSLTYLSTIVNYCCGARDFILVHVFGFDIDDTQRVIRKSGELVALGLCAALGDTWSSEIGQVWGYRPRDIIPPFGLTYIGKNGGVTLPGVAAAVAAGGLVATVFRPGDIQFVIEGGLVGVTGSIIDSIMGATLQPSALDLYNQPLSDNLAALVLGIHELKLNRVLSADAKKVIEATPIGERCKQIDQELQCCTTATGSNVLDNGSINFLAPGAAVLLYGILRRWSLKRLLRFCYRLYQ